MARPSAPVAALVATLLLAAAWSPAIGASRQLKVDAPTLLALGKKMEDAGDARQAMRVYRALEGDTRSEVRAEARFRLAKLLAADGKRVEAAVVLRRIIDDHPTAVPVRLELAGLLHQLGDEKSALRELRALGTLDLPLNVARLVDRMSASLQARKPIGFQVELALAPDSNINRSTRSDTLGTVFGDFTLDRGSKARSGVGAALRGLAQARHAFSDDLAVVARASGEANLYRDKDFNDITLDFAAGPELRLGRTRLAMEAGISQQYYGMKPYQRGLRLAGSVTRPIDPVSQVRVDAGARWADNRFNDLQDGRGLSLRARYERALSPSLVMTGQIGLDRFKARDDAYSTRSWNAGFAAYQQVGRMTLSAGIDFGRLKADQRLSLLPAAREDKLLRLTVGSVFRQFTVAGFAPITRFVFERNKSNVEFYDYRRTRTEFGISRAF